MFVNIKGARYKIKICQVDSSIAGYCDKNKKIIGISNLITNKDFRFQVLAHELCHAYFTEYKLDAIINHEMEEMVCLMVEDLVNSIKPFMSNKWAK